jgi:hypothetical protein
LKVENKELKMLAVSLSKKRSEEFYAWWDVENNETIIYNYGKK